MLLRGWFTAIRVTLRCLPVSIQSEEGWFPLLSLCWKLTIFESMRFCFGIFLNGTYTPSHSVLLWDWSGGEVNRVRKLHRGWWLHGFNTCKHCTWTKMNNGLGNPLYSLFSFSTDYESTRNKVNPFVPGKQKQISVFFWSVHEVVIWRKWHDALVDDFRKFVRLFQF